MDTLSRWCDKVAVVTGASAGIGEKIAEVLVNKGLLVVGLARRKSKLDEIAMRLENKPGKFFPIVADMTKEDDIAEAFKWLKTNVGPVSILVNNAGIFRVSSSLIDGNTAAWKETLDTNVLGLCVATKLAIKNMSEYNINGHIIHINSIAGHPGHNSSKSNVYAASKCAVTALTETLRQELHSIGSKIKVTSISPAFVRTEILAALEEKFTEEQKKHFDSLPHLKPEDIVDSVVYVLSTPEHVQVHELIIEPIGRLH